jgi:hypothetical protein
MSAAADALPPAPEGLGDAGQRLWTAIHAQLAQAEVEDGCRLVLTEREQSLLRLAARQADDLALLEESIEQNGAMVTGSKGQPVVNPALAEARQARLAISRLLGALRLPDDGEKPETSASQRGQDAARARWRRRPHMGVFDGAA